MITALRSCLGRELCALALIPCQIDLLRPPKRWDHAPHAPERSPQVLGDLNMPDPNLDATRKLILQAKYAYF